MSTPSIIIHGPQGCGKTYWASTLAAALGLQQAIELDDFAITASPRAATHIGRKASGDFRAKGCLGITASPRAATRIARKFRGANQVDVLSFDEALLRLPVPLQCAISDWRAGNLPASTPPPDPATAPGILQIAADAIADRAAARDQPTGERSMARTVAAFNAITGRAITEREGWLFMAQLKAARAWGGNHHADDYVDGAAYFGLAGESAAREHSA